MAQIISKMSSVIRMGKSLIVNTKPGQALILVTRKVMAVEDQCLHRSSTSLGFCNCEVIDPVRVRPLAQPEGGDPSETPASKYKFISKWNKNTNTRMIKRMHDLVPTTTTGFIRANTSASSTIARKTSDPEPGTTRDKDAVNAAPPLHQTCALKARVYATATRSHALPMIRAGLPRSAACPTSTTLMLDTASDPASARRQRTARRA